MAAADSIIENPSAATKAVLRRQARLARAALPTEQRAEASAAVAGYLAVQFADHRPATMAGYWPIGEELDPRPALIRLAAAGHVICLPVTGRRDEALRFRRWVPGAALVPAGFGTLAPAEDAPECVPDLLLMPLLAFDAAGNRLGYGAGHYDRTLASLASRPTCIGLAFAVQEVDTVPREAHDRPMDMIITERGPRPFGGTTA